MRKRERFFYGAWLEIVCYFAGHDWKSSWRSRDDRKQVEATPESEWPISWKLAGNPFFTHSAGWHYRCRRCRMRTREDSWYPWYVVLRGAVRSFWRSWWIGATCYRPSKKNRQRIEGRDYVIYPWYSFPVSLLTAPLFGFEQAWGAFWYHWKWPVFPLVWASELSAWAHDRWIDGKAKTMYWHGPQDPNDPHELGFWTFEKELVSPRTRFWMHGGNGSVGNAKTIGWSGGEEPGRTSRCSRLGRRKCRDR